MRSKKTKAANGATPTERILSVRISAAAHKRARVFALQTDTTFQAVLTAALDEYLKKRGA